MGFFTGIYDDKNCQRPKWLLPVGIGLIAGALYGLALRGCDLAMASDPPANTWSAMETGYRSALRTIKRLEREKSELLEENAALKKEISQLREDGD